MTYVMSDIHGNYQKYREALEEISFKDTDTLYVLGNVIDFGEQSMEILLDMMVRVNVLPLAGDHEVMALKVLPAFLEETTPEKIAGLGGEFMENLKEWQENGGESSLLAFKNLSYDYREAVLDYLEEFEPYAEVEVNGEDYVLVHAGLENFSEDKELDEYELEDLLFTAPDYEKVYFQDRYLVTGHTNTSVIDDSGDVIFYNNNHIAIDCGCAYGGVLGVYCLENGDEFYI